MSLKQTSHDACERQAILSFGSNLGNRAGYLSTAVRHLGTLPHTRVLALSSLYETQPVHLADQPDFLNATGLLETELSPLALLDECLRIEASCGRRRQIPKGPRTLDIDLIFFGRGACTSSRLTLPHPRYALRAFVCVPLTELFLMPPLATSASWAFLGNELARLPSHIATCSAACRRLPPMGNFPYFPTS